MRPMLDSVLPAIQVESDLREMICGREIELEDGKVSIGDDVRLELISRSFYANEVDIGFGRTYYRAVVAVGGVRSVANGVVDAEVCFATLWYTGDRQLITVDFSTEGP